jgi:ribosomal protein L34E
MPKDFHPLERVVCEGCGRPVQGWYEERASHMAAAFRSGITPNRIASAYGMSPEWAMKLITEQLGKEAVTEIVEHQHERIASMG